MWGHGEEDGRNTLSFISLMFVGITLKADFQISSREAGQVET